MKRLFVCVFALGLATSAWAADDKAAAPDGPPPMGPMSRMVTKEDKKGVDEMYKAMDAAWKARDINAAAALIDFPVFMATDNAKGEYMGGEWDKATWIAEMSKAMAGMPPDDAGMKMTMKRTPHFLSDTLAVVVEETDMKMGKMKAKWKGYSVITKKGDKWMVKQMSEAGWGDVMAPKPAPKAAAVPAPAIPAAPPAIPAAPAVKGK
jgi:hypothetical protein